MFLLKNSLITLILKILNKAEKVGAYRLGIVILVPVLISIAFAVENVFLCITFILCGLSLTPRWIKIVFKTLN